MNQEATTPYVTRCGFCQQGLVRLMRCKRCDTAVAVCDECELAWRDFAALRENPQVASSGAFPACPACHAPNVPWAKLSKPEIIELGLGQYVTRDSV